MGMSVFNTLVRDHRGSTGPAEHLLRTIPPPNMAAANFVVITNGEGCALNGTAVAAVLIDQ